MDDTTYEIPSWLPWATTACLAAVVACVGELWLIERSRSELLMQDSQIAKAAAKASDNQLEAERIMNARQIQQLSGIADPGAGLQVIPLAAPAGVAAGSEPASAVVIVDPVGGRGQLRLYGTAFGRAGERDYQLWIDGPGSEYPALCGVVHVAPDEDKADTPIGISAVVGPGCRFMLITGAGGAAGSLEAAKAGGSIVLASPPYSGKISGR